MALAIKYEDRIKPVRVMVGARADWLSLVGHSANWHPIATMKNEKGNIMPGLRVQAILLPNGKTITDLSELPGAEWLEEINATKTEQWSDGRISYVIASKSEFDEASLQIKELRHGIKAVVGKPKDATKADLMELPTDPLNIPIGAQVIPLSFAEVLGSKIRALDQAICAAYELEPDEKRRAKKCVEAAKAFTDWLTQATKVQAEKTESVKTDSSLRDLANQIVQAIKGEPVQASTNTAIKSEIDTGGEDMNEEQVTEIVTEASKAASEAVLEKYVAQKSEQSDAITKRLDEIASKQDEFGTRLEKLEKGDTTSEGKPEPDKKPDGEQAGKSEGEPNDPLTVITGALETVKAYQKAQAEKQEKQEAQQKELAEKQSELEGRIKELGFVPLDVGGAGEDPAVKADTSPTGNFLTRMAVASRN